MDITDSYNFGLAEFGGNEQYLRAHNQAVSRACDFIYKKLGNLANIDWMHNCMLKQFNGLTFDEIRDLNDVKKMCELSDAICSGRIPVDPPPKR